MELETQLQTIFKDVLKTDITIEVFAGFVDLSPKSYEISLNSCLDQFRTFYNNQSFEDHVTSVKVLVKFIHDQKNARRVVFMFDFIEACIKDGFLPAKMVLDNLQPSELVYSKKVHWLKTYEVIQKFVHMVDYKGCRNLLNAIICKMREIPAAMWNVARQQVNVICKVIEHLLEPEVCLLPGYLAVNEIRQIMPEEQLIAPWPLLEKLTTFVDRFRATSNMVSTTGRWMLLPVVNNTFHQLASTWRLEHDSLRFPIKRQLPYCKEMYQRQWRLLRYILGQAHSRDMVLQMLGLQKHQKQRCIALEVELVELLLEAVTSGKKIVGSAEYSCAREDDRSHLQWLHLSGQVIFFVFYQFASIPHMVELLYARLAEADKQEDGVYEGRDRLMWVLLQFISGSIQKIPFNDFLPVVKLVNLLYPERQPLPLCDVTKSSCAVTFAAMCILMHLNRKSQSDSNTSSSNNDSDQQCLIPVSLQNHHQYIIQCLQMSNLNLQDYRIALVCNACCTTSELFSGPIAVLVDSIFGDQNNTFPMPGTNCVASNKVVPLSMELLDSLTAHTKMSMLHQIGLKMQKIAQSKSSVALSPSVVETYSRLLVYTEIESLGTKTFVNQVLPKVAGEFNWQVLYTLLEMISYRMHHIHTVFRTQLLVTQQKLASMSQVNHRQLHFRVESTALRLIMGFDNLDINPQLVRLFNDQKHIVSPNSEELNRVLVLTLARAIYITGAETISGSWCTDILKSIMAATPHKWPQKTLAFFPRSMQDYFQQHTVEASNKAALRSNVEEEYSKWEAVLTTGGATESKYSDSDVISHFTSPNHPYLICLLWKALFEGKTLSIKAYKILERIGASQLSAHERTFSDFLITEFSQGGGGDHVKPCLQLCADLLRDMVWKYNIIFLDRLILCLALRSSETSEIQCAFFIIQYLLIKPDFRNRVHHLVQEIDNIDHWTQNDWHAKHIAYHQKFPEMHYFEGLAKHCYGDDGTGDAPSLPQPTYLPTYFSNIALRFLPVLDVVIHRCLELLPNKSLEILLDHVGQLYKFHDKPITFLFNTLHYYEAKLRDSPPLKKKIVSTIIGAITENKPSDWALSQEYLNYCLHTDDTQWQPSSDYYCNMVKRLVDSIDGKKPPPFASRDWRFNEFPNACAHALQVTCVEAMALPAAGETVGQALMDVVLKSQPTVNKSDVFAWMNSVALILTSLPEVYWKPLHKSILRMIRCETLTTKIEKGATYPYHILSFSNQQMSLSDLPCTRLLALTHIVWHHMSIGQLSLVSQFLKDEIRPIVETELQMLFVFHLIGPYIPRFQLERTRCMMDVALVLYEILLRVSQHGDEIVFVDEIADFLYHVKYMHIGVAINDKVEEVMGQLQPALRKRLRFITHASSSSSTSSSTSSRPQQSMFSSGSAPTSGAG